MRLQAMSLMRASDVVRCDFGTPSRGRAGFVRPAIVVTSDDVLEFRQHAIVVVPCATTRRGWLSEVDITGFERLIRVEADHDLHAQYPRRTADWLEELAAEALR